LVGDSGSFLLLDANVLIDYRKTKPSILALVSRHVGKIQIPSTILDEVEDIDLEACERLDLNVVEPELVQLLAAAEKRGSLSQQDHLCLILAREHGWICVTNDGALRTACRKEGVAVRWGLELILDLVQGGHLAANDALDVAKAIHATNPFHISAEILRRFMERLREITGKK
jgi:rRNA-processing protein FCF1